MIDHRNTPQRTMQGHSLGWRGSEPHDDRDYLFRPEPALLVALPRQTSNAATHPTWLLPQSSEDQLDEGSCTGWAARKLCYWAYNAMGWHHPFPPSPRALYYCERQILELPPYNIAGATGIDCGGYGRAVIAASAHYGITNESNCPYAPDGDPQHYVALPPDAATYLNMHKHLSLQYQHVQQDRTHMQAALAAGHMFIFGFQVVASFESAAAARTGIVPMPQPGEQVLGGHEMACIDYYTDAAGQLWYVALGSWGLYGDAGKMYFKAEYLEDTSLTDDLWLISKQI